LLILFVAVRGWRMRDVMKDVQLLDMAAMTYIGVEGQCILANIPLVQLNFRNFANAKYLILIKTVYKTNNSI
jgi:hypothetical protein